MWRQVSGEHGETLVRVSGSSIKKENYLKQFQSTHKKSASAGLLFAGLLIAAPAFAQSAPSLGTASSFAALSGAGLTCTGSSVIGDVGSLLTVTGFPPPVPALCGLAGSVHAGDATARAAYDAVFVGANSVDSVLAAQQCDFNHPTVADQQLSGQTLASGVHCFPTTALLNGPAPLNLVGNGPWVLRLGTALTTGGTSSAPASVLVNGRASCGAGVFWQLGSAATIGTNTAFVGNILAGSAITFTGTNSSLVGRAFAKTAVTMTGTDISVSNCGTTPPSPPTCDKHDKREHGERDRHDKQDKNDKNDKKDKKDKKDCDDHDDDGHHGGDGHHGDDDHGHGENHPFGGSDHKKRD
jgi:hypothetical protein